MEGFQVICKFGILSSRQSKPFLGLHHLLSKSLVISADSFVLSSGFLQPSFQLLIFHIKHMNSVLKVLNLFHQCCGLTNRKSQPLLTLFDLASQSYILISHLLYSCLKVI